MTLLARIEKILLEMTPISLDEIADCAFTDRVDTKFVFPVYKLVDVLALVKDDYAVLSIDGKQLLPYSTLYFDTLDCQLQRWHENGKANRFKLRQRHYEQTQQAFLELKYKTNQGKTVKHRIDNNVEDSQKADFFNSISGFKLDNMQAHSYNRFSRITLVCHEYSVRITIDINMHFSADNQHWNALDGICVAELKTRTYRHPLFEKFKQHQIYPLGFSKFIVGMHLNGMPAKLNRYKSLFKQLKSMQALVTQEEETVVYQA